MLVGSKIDKNIGAAKILHGINIRVAPGEITAILGPSGGGKSTLLRALSLLDPPDQGSVDVDGQIYTFPQTGKHPIPPPWPLVTVVFQQLFLWPHLTLRRNITLPFVQQKQQGKLNSLATADQEIDELLERFHLSAISERFPNEVSVGQRQLIAMIRAFVLKPKYLLLDEVTSALDVEHVSNILDYLKLLRKQGTGVLLATHLIGFAKSAADQIVFIDKGRVVETGGRSLLATPQDERLSRFLSLVEAAS
jgi:polar amino acid transport system ATP-binding protein